MIELFSGTPGSGKSFHACQRIYYWLQTGWNIIANFPCNFPETYQEKKMRGKFEYVPNDKLTVKYLVDFAKANHKERKEHQTLIIIDEAGIKFNARCWRDSDRFEWLNFLSQHRKFGFDIVMIAQADLMLDKQMRQFIEIEHNHRLMKSCGKMGYCLSLAFNFLDVKMWYGIKLPLGNEYIRYSKKIANIYDSYSLFDESWNEVVENGK